MRNERNTTSVVERKSNPERFEKKKPAADPMSRIMLCSCGVLLLSGLCRLLKHIKLIAPSALFGVPLLGLQIVLIAHIVWLSNHYVPSPENAQKHHRRFAILVAVDIFSVAWTLWACMSK